MRKRIRLCLALARAIQRVPTLEEWDETRESIYEMGYDLDYPTDAIHDTLHSELWSKCPVCGEWFLTDDGVFESPDDWDTAGPFCSEDCVEEFRIQQGFDPHREWGTY